MAIVIVLFTVSLSRPNDFYGAESDTDIGIGPAS